MTGMSYPLHMYADNVFIKIQLQFSYSRGQNETFPLQIAMPKLAKLPPSPLSFCI